MTCRIFLLLSLLYAALPLRLPAEVIYVKASANGSATNGLSWETAFQTIQTGVNAANNGDELWVAAGTYAEHLTLKEGITLFGGFAGTETSRSQRNWNVHKSIIDGGRSGRVISLDIPLAQPTRVDGFVLQNGSNDFGGGVYSAGGNFVFANNLVVGNEARGPNSGGGMFVDESATFPAQPLLTLFTTISDRLLSAHASDLSSSHIPLFPTNRYTPEVHRLLQVAANICDATTNRGESYPFYPSVFRPIFTNNNGSIAISGYVEANDAQFISNSWLDLKLAQDRLQLTSDEVRSNANLYGQAIIIGAKKGFPNFNEFSMETFAQVVRKLELRKPDWNIQTSPNETNQMYLLGITNVLGVEAWNSYTNDFSRPIELHVRLHATATVTNHVGARLVHKTTTSDSGPILVTNWAAVKIGSFLSPLAFKLPLHGSVPVLPSSQYIAFPSQFQVATNASFQKNTGFAIPTWFLLLTNRVQYFAVDNGRVIDFVNLDALVTHLDLTRVLLSTAFDPWEDPLMATLWSTNRVNNSPVKATLGMLKQIDISLGEIPPGNYWNDYSISRKDISIEKQIDQFRFFMGYSPLYGNVNLTPTNRIQAPFSPIRGIYCKVAWQANDPLVHHQIDALADKNFSRLRMIIPPVKTYDQFSESNLGRLNERLNPYFGNPHLGSTNNPFWLNGNRVRDGALQDTNIRWPQDWDFPSSPTFNLSWLDRVHRGTPWQTLFTGNSNRSTSQWQNWSGSAETHATNDWSIIHALLTNKNAFGATPAATSAPILLNNTFAQNVSDFPGAGVAIFSSGTFVNNIVAKNDSGLSVINPTPGLLLGKNIVAANRTNDLEGIPTGSWNIAEDPQFISAGNFRLRATSPAFDSGSEDVLGNGLLLNEPARVHGARLDLGAYELHSNEAPLLEFSVSGQNSELLTVGVVGFNGEFFVLERSEDLEHWSPIQTNQTANGRFDHNDLVGKSKQFYRAVSAD